MFLNDLIKLIPFKIRLYFIKVKTYCGTNKIKNSVINTDELINIENNHVLVVDDILDTGETLDSVIKSIELFKPKTIKTTTLLCKNIKRKHEIKIDFIGFNIPDKWVIGYGMDTDQYYRNLNEICVLNNG
jgi:hypoxanthine phosphoribosyltransferase